MVGLDQDLALESLGNLGVMASFARKYDSCGSTERRPYA